MIYVYGVCVLCVQCDLYEYWVDVLRCHVFVYIHSWLCIVRWVHSSCFGYIHWVGDLSGSSMVLSSSCNWVNEYISFVCGCELCGVCGLMSEMCVWNCMGIFVCVAFVALLWPRIAGSVGVIAWVIHDLDCRTHRYNTRLWGKRKATAAAAAASMTDKEGLVGHRHATAIVTRQTSGRREAPAPNVDNSVTA